jgi:calcineurin-binding protein cabin-1
LFFFLTVVSKEKSSQVEPVEAAQNPSDLAAACAHAHQEVGGASASQSAIEAQKATAAASQLARSGSSRAMENAQDSGEKK